MMVEKPRLKIVGEDGNAFSILGRALRAARTADWPKGRVEQFRVEALSGGYDNLLAACTKYFNVS